MPPPLSPPPAERDRDRVREIIDDFPNLDVNALPMTRLSGFDMHADRYVKYAF